jgi:hypothetical protein
MGAALRKSGLALLAIVVVGCALAPGLGASSASGGDASSSATIYCYVSPPGPPTRNGSVVHGFGAASCDGPVVMGIKVCIARNGVRWECAPGFTSYHSPPGIAFSTSWSVNSSGCVRGISYSTVVEFTARAANVAVRTKESPHVRICG